MRQKWEGMGRKQQRQYILDGLSTSCDNKVDWKDVKFQMMVGHYKYSYTTLD